MHTEKFKVAGCRNILAEADRTLYGKKDCQSKGLIDPERTHLNYNLCPHEPYREKEIKEIYTKITGKTVRKDAVMGSTIVDLPKDFKGDVEAFFVASYEGLKKEYNLSDTYVIQAYVHMDETTPHMHFQFMPHCEKDGKETINWNKTMPKRTYQNQHKDLEKFLSKQGIEAHLLNGNTLGIDLNALNHDEREKHAKMSAEIIEMSSSLENGLKIRENLNKAIETKQIYEQSLDQSIVEKTKKEKELTNTVQGLESRCQDTQDMINANTWTIEEQKKTMQELSDNIKALHGLKQLLHTLLDLCDEVLFRNRKQNDKIHYIKFENGYNKGKNEYENQNYTQAAFTITDTLKQGKKDGLDGLDGIDDIDDIADDFER